MFRSFMDIRRHEWSQNLDRKKSEMGRKASISFGISPGEDDMSMIIWIVVTVIMVFIAICRCVASRNDRK